MNNVFDDTDDYLSVELKAIIDHKSSNDVLKIKFEYAHGDKQYHPIHSINDKDSHATANYIIKNDLDTTRNMTHGRWVCLELTSLKRTLRRCCRSDFLGFEATTFNPSPTSKKQRSRRYAKNDGVPAGMSHMTPEYYRVGLNGLRLYNSS